MKRSRSALARHRQRKLLEATAHVSSSSELRVVASLAGVASIAKAREALEEDDEDELRHDAEAVNQVVRVLRNVKNSVYHRAMAARALGLLMLHVPTLLRQLGLESEDLLDALLQLVNCCRRFETHNADTRRVHVNCCLVISMLMRTATQQSPQERLQLVVSLDSELLAMPSRPTERTSGFLLLTVNGRPETAADTRIDGGGSHQERVPLKPIRRLPQPPSLPQQRQLVEPKIPSFQLKPDPTEAYGKPKPTSNSPAKAAKHASVLRSNRLPAAVRSEPDAPLAAQIQQRQTPNRQFKMDRNRVITPALVPSTGAAAQVAGKNLPVIPPSRGQMRPPGREEERPPPPDEQPAPTNNQLDSSPRASPSSNPLNSPPPTASALLNANHMVEIFRTGRMPVASAGYFHERLRDDDELLLKQREKTGERTPSRLHVVEWGEWRRRSLSSDDHADITSPRPPSPSVSQVRAALSTASPPVAEDIHTPAYKRQRLRDILTSPVEPFEHNTAALLALDRRVSTTNMHALGSALCELRDSEARTRQQTRSMIEKERDKLPLKFLFQLPGGAAYCRDRMRKAVMLWLLEFEANQKRMALLQWKAFVEHCRFHMRGQVYHRLAIEKRLKVAIEYVLRGYQQQALKKWIETVQFSIWDDRDTAVRKIQRQARRYCALRRFLAIHDAHPVGGPVLRDVYLEPPRESSRVAFPIPLRVREERRRIWHAAQLVQGVYRKRRFRKFLKRFRVAATKIQARARMRIERARYRLVRRRLITFQAFVRMQHDYRLYQALRRAAILVQVNFRCVRIKRLRYLVVQSQRRQVEWKLTSALLIQRIARGFLARLDARRRMKQRDEEFLAALVVQRAWYRRNNEWSTFLLLGCLRMKETEEIAFDKHVLAWQRHAMSKRIQRAWRRHRFRGRTVAAAFVQRSVRRWIATRFVQRKRLEKMAHRRIKWFFRFRHANRIRMATKLQFWWLRAVPGRLAEHIRHRRLALEADRARDRYNRREDAAVVLQSSVRGMRGRQIARRERSARVLQRAAREFIHWRRVKREIHRIKCEFALDRANEWIGAAFGRVYGATMARLNAAATELQRFTRGCLWRSQLTKVLVENELRTRMARRIQSLWRQNAQKRLAQRVLSAQKRRCCNPFKELNSVSLVLKAMTKEASHSYDPHDELQGLHPAAWLRRLGLNEDEYLPRFQKEANALQKLRETGDLDSCSRMLERLGVANDDDAQLMTTSLLAAHTLGEIKRLRAQLETLRLVQRDGDKRVVFVQQQLQHELEAKKNVAERLEDVLTEAEEFRNPPKALREKREKLTTELEDAAKSVKAMEKKLAAMGKRLAQRKMEMLKLQETITSREKDEVSAVYTLQNIRLVEQLSVARDLFLSKFPGLEARALAFVGALEEVEVTTWQLLRFFQVNTTISQVKASMPTLTYFKYATDVKKHDHARFSRCGDLLQFGFERLAEILEVSVDEVVLRTQGENRGALAEEKDAFLPAMVVEAIARALRVRHVKDRAIAWTESARELAVMNTVATRVQSQWRRRAAARVTLLLRSNRLKKELRDAYLAEVRADYVTPIWQQERDKEKREFEEWEREEARAAREEALQETLRYPWVEDWDEDSQSYVVYRILPRPEGIDEDGTPDEYEYATEERPVYTVKEEDAAIVMQAMARRFLARLDLHELRRERRRALQKLLLEEQWLSKATERSQTMTLQLKINVKADERVALWLGHRQKQKQRLSQKTTALPSAAAASPKRQRQKPAVSDDAEKKKAEHAAVVDAFDKELASTSVVSTCEASYHRSVRTEHRRHVLFPSNARPHNLHAQALLDVVEASEKLERAFALKSHADMTLAFTKVALPFGWQEIGGGASGTKPFYYHAATQETSWDRPQYEFEHEYAAIKIQSVARVAIALAARATELDSISFVETVHSTVQLASRVGWVGFGLEGISASVLLSRLGLAKYNGVSALTALSVADLLRVSEAKLKKLGWNNEEMATLKSCAAALRGATPSKRRRFPLSTACAISLAPTTKHAFNFLPNERVLQQIVAQSLPNQQGRVLGLVRAVKQSSTPISYRQLEMHLRLYAGRPDDAVSHIGDIASLSYATQEPQEKAIMDTFMRCIERCIVYTANLKLQKLHAELSTALRVANALLQTPPPPADTTSEEEDPVDETNPRPALPPPADAVALKAAGVLASIATPIAPPASTSPAEVASCVEATRRRCVASPVKGMWEHDCQSSHSALSFAQVALFLRERGLERVLLWYRCVTTCQATYRMHKMREWYRSVVAYRRYSATIVQCAWRGYCAMESRRLLESQQRSPYEQRYDKLTKTFFFVYTPTSEKLQDEPRDAHGAMLPYRPMVQDRVTKRWIQAWPNLATKATASVNAKRSEHDWEGDASPCSVCHVERAARRCNECYSPSGDYVDYCLVCFYDRHQSELSWHTFVTLHRLKTRAFHCVECKRLSTMRCLMCHEHYCERCFLRVHHKGHTRVRHTCEHYEPLAAVCVECEACVAFQKCLVCQDALCEECMTRTHARGAKQNHELKLIKQKLVEDAGFVYCEQCHARRGDTTCAFCAMTLCQLCLMDATKHAVICPETQLQLKKKELLGDRLCVECHKPADRQCETCGDKYCSVKWMGNPGCFERFHWKGKRADHNCVALENVSREMPHEILELEEKVKQKRRRDAELAEQEAKAMAAALEAEAAAALEKARQAKSRKGKRRRVSVGGSKRRLLGTASSRAVCSVDECSLPTLSAALPFCAKHLTSQHALEVSKEDPLEAAKLLALVERNGGKLPVAKGGLWGLGLFQMSSTRDVQEKTSRQKKEKTKKTAKKDKGGS